MTHFFGPRPLSPRDGLDWLHQALLLLLGHPRLFLGIAVLAPVGSALLLSLPIWDFPVHLTGGWLAVLTTMVCYGLPLSIAVCLACGFARAVSRQRPAPLQQLLIPTVLKVLLRTALLLFILLAQGYVAIYLIQHLVNPAALIANMEGNTGPTNYFLGVTDTILGTQLNMIGCLLLVLQLLFAGFAVPVQLFQELPIYTCWRLSFRAIQLNPWVGPAMGLPGLLLILLSYFDAFSVLAQILALPLPPYLGALLYVAWRDVFQGGMEDEMEAQEEEVA